MIRRVKYYYVCAFVAGMATMVLELITTRLFAPYFGSGLNTWASIISATLLYLALGYHRGGRKVDKNPSDKLLKKSFFIAGVTILITPFIFLFNANYFPIFLLPLYFVLYSFRFFIKMDYFTLEYLKPLMTSFIFLYFPLTRLGEIIPICVGLVAKDSQAIGKTSGNIYALSTLGSLIGTLGAGFILIPFLPIWLIYCLISFVLIIIGLLEKPLRVSRLVILIFIIVILFILPIKESYDYTKTLVISKDGRKEYVDSLNRKLLESKNSLFGKIDVGDFKNRRYMLVDRLLQTSMPPTDFLQKKRNALTEKYFFELLPYLNPDGKTALIIGLGGGLIDKIFSQYNIDTEFVEIDGRVIKLAKKYFDFKGKVTHGDGRQFLRYTKEKYDFIIIDAYISDMLPFYLFTRECFKEVRNHLTKNGILAINLISFPVKNKVTSSVKLTLQDIFPYVIAYRSETKIADDVQCLFFFASQQPLSPNLNNLSSEEKDNFESLLKQYSLEFDDYPGVVVRDMFAPLDYQWAKIAVNWRDSQGGIFAGGLIGMIWCNHFKGVYAWTPHRKQFEDFKLINKALSGFSVDAGQRPETKDGLIALIKRDAPIGMMTAKNDYSYLEGDVENLLDPFSPSKKEFYRYAYEFIGNVAHSSYILVSNGPDYEPDIDEKAFRPYRVDSNGKLVPNAPNYGLPKPIVEYIYDPTNGTFSSGDLIYVEDMPEISQYTRLW